MMQNFSYTFGVIISWLSEVLIFLHLPCSCWPLISLGWGGGGEGREVGGRHVTWMGDMRCTNKILGGKYETKWQIWWKNNIKMVHKGHGWIDIHWINLAEIRSLWQADVSMEIKFFISKFAMFWMLYSVFWVIPRRLNFMCRHFRTLCSIVIDHVNKKNNWDEIARLFIQVKVWLKGSLGQSEGWWVGEGACPSRGTGFGGQWPQVGACSKTRI